MTTEVDHDPLLLVVDRIRIVQRAILLYQNHLFRDKQKKPLDESLTLNGGLYGLLDFIRTGDRQSLKKPLITFIMKIEKMEEDPDGA